MKSLKIFFVILILGLGVSPLKAQVSFSHSTGSELLFGSSSYAYAITYSPRFNFINLGASNTLSLGTHLGVGFVWIEAEPDLFEDYNILAYDLPLVVEYNAGYGSSADDDEGFGFFVGGGYGISKYSTSANNVRAKGPLVNAGIRFSYFEKPMGLRGSVLFDSVNAGSKVYAIEIFYTMEGATFGSGESIESRRTRNTRSTY